MIAKLKNGYKIYTSPPPASGGITAAILKIFDQFGFTPEERFDEEVYVKLVEAMKFAYGQRSKVGDPEGNEFKDEIEKVNLWYICKHVHIYHCVYHTFTFTISHKY